MIVAEPMTLLTDLLLGGLGLTLARRLSHTARGDGRRAARWWVLALAAAGLAALAGGIWHGFHQGWAPLTGWLLWRATVWSVGVASCAMLVATFHARVRAPLRGKLQILAVVQFAIYGLWMIGHSDFQWVIADYVPAMAVVLGLHGWAFWRRRLPADGWMVAGVAVSLAAAAVQALELAPDPRFNHNDLYHVIQMAALACFYRGARGLLDLDPAASPAPAPTSLPSTRPQES